MRGFSSEVHRDRRSRSTGAEGEVPQAPSNRSAASSPSGTRHDGEKPRICDWIAGWGPLVQTATVAAQAQLLHWHQQAELRIDRRTLDACEIFQHQGLHVFGGVDYP